MLLNAPDASTERGAPTRPTSAGPARLNRNRAPYVQENRTLGKQAATDADPYHEGGLNMTKQKSAFGKPTKVVFVLALLVIVSLFGGTMGIYSKQLPISGDSQIGPKNFAFEAAASITDQSVEPGGSASYEFTVSNFNGSGTAEVALQTYATVYFPGSLVGTGRVLAQLYYEGALLGSSDTGTLYCSGATLPANEQTTDTYTLTLSWLDADMAVLGDSKWQTITPSQVHINMAGYQ